MDDGLDGSASSWAYRFAIVGQLVIAVRRVAVKVNGSDGKIGSNKARHCNWVQLVNVHVHFGDATPGFL